MWCLIVSIPDLCTLTYFSQFCDKPDDYRVWKASFKEVIKELNVEFDLMIKWLGPESNKVSN